MSRLVRRPADELDVLLLRSLTEWLAVRRWFPLKGATGVELTVTEALHLDDEPEADAREVAGTPPAEGAVRVLLVRARRDLAEHLLQVPVVVAPRGAGIDAPGTIAVLARDGGRAVVDGAAHPRFVAAWLDTAERTPGVSLDVDPATARAITGEQSNTSVLLAAAPGAAPTAMLKVLRTLAPGDNPDIDVPRRLAALGWPNVPAPIAWLEGDWSSPASPRAPSPDTSAPATFPEGIPAASVDAATPATSPAHTVPRASADAAVSRATDRHGHLGVLAEFVPGAADGFELACDLARTGRPFADLTFELGATVAGLHAALREAYPVTPASPADVAASIADRFAWATAALPRLAGYADGVAAVLGAVRALPGVPPRQRVHGDLHLGQVLRSPDRWYVLDFEGEPAAPLELRTRPDLALRDVAGILRSIDYAAAVGGLRDADADAWTAPARAALRAGYAQSATDDLSPDATSLLLTALELDKALYESVYEARNRPDWLPIPLAGLDRLLAARS
ncbi:aminoglycoside phosphotransferase [Cellulomonas alba]|uniref:Aminoglycoside phosphotransferase n=1 Tax=Cellulomonas alba TaxID=3053467 RepID=A0ABT7SK30_9CELL|nr:aminoglycoside phosphotransferase [Cellulomonas alba]MDM7856516.1 aminoglycoside phosphotransferase [Cellulomonas alba]